MFNLNNAQKNILLTFLTLWLTFHLIVLFLTAYSKIAWNMGALCEHRHRDAFRIYWQQYRYVLLQTNPDYTSHIL